MSSTMNTNRVCRILRSAALALWLGAVFVTVTVARDINVHARVPLERTKVIYLDKAKGIGPRFRFASAPPELSSSCASSISVNMNDGNFVDYPGERTLEEFRAKADAAPLNPTQAVIVPAHEPFTLKGEGPISNAMCTNIFIGANARGFCTGTVAGQSYTVVYNFDPIACLYDNIAIGRSLEERLLVDNDYEHEPELDCATKLKQFVADIDDVLASRPHDILEVFDVLDPHFPLHGCTIDVVSNIIKTSKYFRSASQNGPKMHVFVLNNDAPHIRGVEVSFALTDTGDSVLPGAGWLPPFL
jgi:hypothetical protein